MIGLASVLGLDMTIMTPNDITAVPNAVVKLTRVITVDNARETPNGITHGVPNNCSLTNDGTRDSSYMTFKNGSEVVATLNGDASLFGKYMAVSSKKTDADYAIRKTFHNTIESIRPDNYHGALIISERSLHQEISLDP
ncbi:hypothetical protein BV25DRAFT_1918001 [Artomyces pyxidatus]|uniref:Uncharacterized protein n=1 Tax=Artomyces pyxidatus TaxID=48021 RepID=A0ACB8SUR6_9AGAM|nr:hypothetical protein BV25DRAFT_1918001 [Artomyces pyxidatus]